MPSACRLAWALLPLALAAMIGLTGCSSISAKQWAQAIAEAQRVEALLQQGDYESARREWVTVDQLIHAAFPELQKGHPQLASDLWRNMGLVELGFAQGNWQEAEEGARPLASLLRQSQQALSGR